MPTADDYSEQMSRGGSASRQSVSVARQLATIAARSKKNELDIYQELDPEVDFKWANYYAEQHPLSYFDYYFTGQDVKIRIEGADQASMSSAGVSPFVDLSYSIQQEKTPVYGMWSYTHDAVMRGTRITTGMFRIATTYPNKMRDMLTQAAQTRSDQRGLNPIRGLDIDETNIQQYWGRNLHDNDNQDRNIFSVHPPFNLIVEYGIQPISLAPDPWGRAAEVVGRYHETGSAMFTDVNERLVHASADRGNMEVILTNVELTGMQAEFTPEGNICSEVYSYFARDVINTK